MKNLITKFITLTLTAVAALSFWKIFVSCQDLELVYYTLGGYRLTIQNALYFLVPGLLAGGFLAYKIKNTGKLNIALSPWGLFLGFLFFKTTFFSILAFISLLGITVFRITTLCPESFIQKIKDKTKIRPRLLLCALAAITALFVGYGIFMQHQGLIRQYLFFTDWGIFLQVADNTLKGNFLVSNWQDNVFFHHHFMPGFFIWFTPLLYLFHSPYTIFAVSALVLWGSTILIYFFARSKNLSPPCCFALSVAYVLYPSWANLCMSLFYGFHVIYTFIPVFIVFYIFYERDKLWMAFFIFLYSLTIKETIATFWIGWAAVQFLSGKRKWATVYGLISFVYLLLCLKLIIPAFGNGGYLYTTRNYGHLGSNIFEIMLSPFIRPEAFWGSLFDLRNALFLLIILIPCFITACNCPLLLLCGVPQLIFIMLQQNRDLINGCFWYHTETVIMLNITAILGFIRLRKNNNPPPWTRFLLWGLKEELTRNKLLMSGLLALLSTAIASHYFFSFSIYGCNDFNRVLKKDDCTKINQAMLQIVPPGVSISATHRVAPVFMLRNPLFRQSFKKDYCVIDMADKLDLPNDFLIKKLESPDYGLIWFNFFKGHQFYIFKRGAKSKFPRPVFKVSDKEWKNMGQHIRIKDHAKDFHIRAQYVKTASGQLSIVFFIRKMRNVDYGCDFLVKVKFTDKTLNWNIPFGYGYYPQHLCKVGEVFKLQIPLPANNIKSAGIKIAKKK